MKIYLFVIFLFGLVTANSQNLNKDFLIKKGGNKIYCSISQIKNGKVKYRIGNKSYSNIKELISFDSIYFSNSNVIKNKFNTVIEPPEPGFAHVYFYSAEQRNYRVYYNSKKFIKVNQGTFYLHKIRSDKIHEYHCYGNKDSEKIILKPEVGGIYFIRGIYNYDNRTIESNKLLIDTSKLSELYVLSMRKKSKKL